MNEDRVTATIPSKKTKHRYWRNRVYNYLKDNEPATANKLLEVVTIGPPPGSPQTASQVLRRDPRFISNMEMVRGAMTAKGFEPRLVWRVKDEE